MTTNDKRQNEFNKNNFIKKHGKYQRNIQMF